MAKGWRLNAECESSIPKKTNAQVKAPRNKGNNYQIRKVDYQEWQKKPPKKPKSPYTGENEQHVR